MSVQKKYKLKIETGINSGSLSLWSDDLQKDFRINDQTANKNDHLLENIIALLNKNHISKREIKKIVYSNYPASQTGLKILTSIFKVFKMLFDVEIEEKNLYNAIAGFYSKKIKADKIIVLPVSNNNLEFVYFNARCEMQSKGKFEMQILKRVFDKKINILTTNELSKSLRLDDLDIRYSILDDNLSAYL